MLWHLWNPNIIQKNFEDNFYDLLTDISKTLWVDLGSFLSLYFNVTISPPNCVVFPITQRMILREESVLLNSETSSLNVLVGSVLYQMLTSVI